MANKYKFSPVDLYSGNANREREVAMMDRHNGRVIRIFKSVREAGREMRIPSPNIVACLKGRITSAGGYCWLYVYEGVTEDGK